MDTIISVFETILGVFKPVLDVIMPWVKPVALTLLALLIFHLFFVRYARRWKDYSGKRRLLSPASWFAIQPRSHFLAKAKLMRNRHVRELYAPTSMYVRDLGENEKMISAAWLGVYPRAIRAAIREANLAPGKKLLASKQINEVASRVQVLPLPNDILVGNGHEAPPVDETPKQRERRLKRVAKLNEKEHFRIDLDLAGKDSATVEKVAGAIKAQLGFNVIDSYKDESGTHISYLLHKEPLVDMLTKTKIYADFFSEHPPLNVYALPLGLTRSMNSYVWEVHHTIILGQTGSGKGSPLQAIIMQMSKYVKQGIVELNAIDPKIAEFRVYNEWRSRLFKRISVGMEDDDMREHAETIARLKTLIGNRAKNGSKTSITAGAEDDGRDFEASKENPLVVFLIDEFPTLFKGFESMGRDGKKPLSDLAQIILTGRSFGVYVVAASQRGDKAILDSIIDSMVHRIVLRHKNPYFNQQFLGDDYMENGNDPASIPAATKSNGYETAGIGFVSDGSGQKKVRFAYTSKEDIARLVREFRELEGLNTSEEEFNDYINETGDWAVMPTIDLDDDGFTPTDAEGEMRDLADYILPDDDDGDFEFEEIRFDNGRMV